MKLHHLIVWAGLLLPIPVSSLTGAATSSQEEALTLAYVYNFAKFTYWPNLDVDAKEIDFCFYGEAQFSSFEAIENRYIDDKKVVLKRLARGEKIEGCHLLFIKKSEEIYLVPLIESVKQKPILTISSINGFANRGGTVELIVINNKMKFIVNKSALHEQNLRLSAKLYQLAHSIVE